MLTALETFAIAMARPSKLEGRLTAILDAGRNRRAMSRTAVFLTVFLLASAVIPMAMIQGVTGENEAAENEGAEEANGVVEIERVEARTFEELSVQFGGIWVWWEKAQLTIKGDGAVEFSMNRAPDDDARYTARSRLRPEHLGQLVQRLKETSWLTRAGANEQPNYTDASRIEMKLVREGKVREACRSAAPGRSPKRLSLHSKKTIE